MWILTEVPPFDSSLAFYPKDSIDVVNLKSRLSISRALALLSGHKDLKTFSASKQFNNEVLKAHNEYRQKHGVPPLKLCKKLNQEAQQYSEALASTRILKHSPESSRGQCGENLAWASYDQPGKEVADRWYSEIKNYNFQQPGFTSGTGHFTAMVWKNTKKMGVGKASASDGSSFVVARYFPAGNVVNQGFFEENVLPPKK
ncbi:Golgi-associated plant pathogenesis-related protein 1 [Echinops telfairi]|uniref:Golgi-associated plant pathogenesis-related protein 1 n=1 Tax=Echinops telfairi TaxID=9371 RepID=A0ABM0ZSH9_ECHTE|nr:Golgi-associated plant pathogenesis-related protein 1 [Echinops telfairi]